MTTQTALFSTYRTDSEKIAPPAPGDRFTWLGEQWCALSISDHCSGRVPIVAMNMTDSRIGVPFADEVHTIIRYA